MRKISIVLPVYNAKEFVDETIFSVINQTFHEWELIIVDDCSPDGTFDYLVGEYSDNKKIRIFQNKVNSGAGITRNTGLENCKFDLIAFIDADDIWLPNKLEVQFAFMRDNNSAIVHSSYAFIDETGSKIPGKVSVSHSVNLQSYMRNTEIGMSTAMINKKVVGSIEFQSMRTRQDTKLWLDLLGQGFIANGINQELVLYRVRNGQISGNKFKVACRTFRVYMSVREISVFSRLINYCYYAVNGVLKRTKK